MKRPNVEHTKLLRDLAELAMETNDVETFRKHALDRLMRASGADAGAYCSLGEGETFDAVLVGTEVNVTSLGRYLRELTPDEVRRTVAPRTQDDAEVLSAARRERLSLYRDFLGPYGIHRYAVRGWCADLGRHCCLTLARTGVYNHRRFVSRTASIVDAVFPVIALGERAHGRVPSPREDRDAGLFSMLSASEAKVIGLLERGLTNREIASVLGLSPNTVRNRVASAFARVGASRRAELVYLLRSRRS